MDIRLFNQYSPPRVLAGGETGEGEKVPDLKADPLNLSLSRKGRRFFQSANAQAFTEYILVFALVALLFGSVMVLWKGPLAHYLNRIAQAVATPR